MLQSLLLLNPLTFVVDQFRQAVFYGNALELQSLALYFTLACLFAWLSLTLFKRLRPTFADLV